MSNVRLERVTKSFKETLAVDDISLEIEHGEFFSLLGPSGCGKTTTLRMVGGFEEPTSGAIYLGDREVSGLPPYKRDVNTVFQSYALFPHLDVHENVAFGLRRKKVEKGEIKTRVEDILSLVGLEGYGKRRPNQLSGGQQQRVALARALVNTPQVLLLDEPLGALDLKLRKHMQLELKHIQTEIGITFVYVTHDQDEAMTMSDRLAVMNAGRFDQIGTPRDVYEYPRTSFVAGFLGASNLLRGRIESADGPTAKVRLAVGDTISVPTERLPARSGDVSVGVRPEKLRVARAGASDEPDRANSIDAVVEMSTYSGVSTSYSCVAGDGTKVTVYVQNIESDEQPVGPGEKVRLTWHPEHTFAVEATVETETKESADV
jgi:spermidine/putrescine transport system ATP-binding protein